MSVAVINAPAPVAEVRFVHETTPLEIEEFAPAITRYVRPMEDDIVQMFLRRVDAKEHKQTNKQQ